MDQFVRPLMQTLNFPNQDGGVKNRKLATPPNLIPGGDGGKGVGGVGLEGAQGYRISGTILSLSYCPIVLHLVV